MLSSEVQRTIVKSPPELWSELSDPAALARHLGEFGEIRITRLEPESAIQWESDSATGEVLIKASGWGTRVTLRARRALPAHDEAAIAGAAEAGGAPGEAEGVAEVQPAQAAPGDGDEWAAAPAPAPAPAPDAWAHHAVPAAETWAAQLSETAPAPQAPEHEPLHTDETFDPHEPRTADFEPALAPHELAEPERPGFFARLFRRRRAAHHNAAYDDAAYDDAEYDDAAHDEELEHLDPATDAHGHGELAYEHPHADFAASALAEEFEPAAPAADGWEQPGAIQSAVAAHAHEHAEPEPAVAPGPAGEPQPTAEPVAGPEAAGVPGNEAATAEVKAVLSSVLDHLGTAHHRPFSRG